MTSDLNTNPSPATVAVAPHRLLRWARSRFSTPVIVFWVAAVIGLLTGVAAFLLKWTIGTVSTFFMSRFHVGTFNYALLLIPVAGIMLTGIFQRYILRHDITHGVARIIDCIDRRRYNLPPYMIWAYTVASTLTLGFGGSAGSEGPIATTGAAIGSNIGRWLGLDQRHIMVMLAVGAGAGIAGIFKAPIGGALFTVEVLHPAVSTLSVISLLVACLVSASTAYVLSGCTVDLSYIQVDPLGLEMTPYVLLLGVACGLYSVYYRTIMRAMTRFYESVRNPWLRNFIGGAVLAVCVFCFPVLYGEGYPMMESLLNGQMPSLVDYGGWLRDWRDPATVIWLCLGVTACKAFATSGANCSGGVAGDFAPTLFAGCFFGMLVGHLLNLATGLDLPVSTMAFIGMGGVMAGVIRAPLMAIFLTLEMTNGYALFLPVMVVCALSSGVVKVLADFSFFRRK